MRNIIQICVLFIAAHRLSAQPFYTGRPRGRLGGRFGPPGGAVFSDRGGSFSSFGASRSFGSVGHPGFSSQRSFRSTGFTSGPSRITSSLDRHDRHGSRFGSRGIPSRISGGHISGGHVSGGRVSGGLRDLPDDVRRVIGSSVLGRPARMGELDLPRHGGAGAGEAHANGLMRGWDGNPQTLGNRFEHEWSDPFRGQPIPRLPHGFNGNFGAIPGMPPFG